MIKRLYDAHVKINFAKSKFYLKEVYVLGYFVSKEGYRAGPKYLDNNIFHSDIKTKKELQRLLGTLNWYRNFVENFSTKISPITDILHTDKFTPLTEEMNKIIKEVSNDIKTQANLKFPDYSKPFRL